MHGCKDEMLNYLTEFFMSKVKNNAGENLMVQISHFVESLQKVAYEKNHLSSKMLLLMMDYEQGYTKLEEAEHAELGGLRDWGKLSGNLMNINEVVNQKACELVQQQYYLFTKVLAKDKYMNTLFGPTFDPNNFTFHKIDLKNKKVSLLIIFALFEKLLGKLTVNLKEQLIDSLMFHYAQNNEYREATPNQKFFSLIAVQVMMKNKSQDNTMHYDWLVEVLYCLAKEDTMISLHDVMNDEFKLDNILDIAMDA